MSFKDLAAAASERCKARRELKKRGLWRHRTMILTPEYRGQLKRAFFSAGGQIEKLAPGFARGSDWSWNLTCGVNRSVTTTNAILSRKRQMPLSEAIARGEMTDDTINLSVEIVEPDPT